MDDDHPKFLPEEVVTKILLRLPMNRLFRFKLVSKLWQSIISHPKLGHSYMQLPRTLPKSPSSSLHLRRSEVKYPYVLLATSDVPGCSTTNRILASSNGLILCTAPTWNYVIREWEPQLIVSNLLTNQSVQLPSTLNLCYEWKFGLVTRPCHSSLENGGFVTYKVVLIRRSRDDGPGTCTIEMFSSDTWSWRSKPLIIRCPEVNLDKVLTYKGAMHWFDHNKTSIVTYDPYNNPDQFGCIQLPDAGSCKNGVNLIHLGHEGLLKYAEIERSSVRVWRLEDYDKGEWCLERYMMMSLDDYHIRRQMFVRDPWKREFFCYAKEDRSNHHGFCYREEVCFFHRKEVFSDHSEMEAAARLIHMKPLISIVLCPWSSPFY